MDKHQDKQICNDIEKLNQLVELVPNDRKPIAEKLVKELAFMAKTLDELKSKIEEHGSIDLFKQGSQEFLRESPALKAYNTTIQRYSLLYKQLNDLLPKQEVEQKPNEFMKFLKRINNELCFRILECYSRWKSYRIQKGIQNLCPSSS